MNDLLVRQLRGLMRIELRKTLFGRRAVPLYLLAMLPVIACTLVVVVWSLTGPPEGLNQGEIALIFANVYLFILRGLIYLGCVWIFMNLFRGEVLDRSLHYYFLAPIRREVLAAGKYAAGWVGTTVLFTGSTLISLALLFGYLGASTATEYLLSGPGLSQWLAYSGITALACLGYGAIFLLIGLFFRNPLIPAILIFQWELLNPVLPPLLKKLSVIFYLQSLLPIVPFEAEGPFAMLADPVPVWLAVPGLVLFTAAILVVAGWRVRRMEIAYGVD